MLAIGFHAADRRSNSPFNLFHNGCYQSNPRLNTLCRRAGGSTGRYQPAASEHTFPAHDDNNGLSDFDVPRACSILDHIRRRWRREQLAPSVFRSLGIRRGFHESLVRSNRSAIQQDKLTSITGLLLASSTASGTTHATGPYATARKWTLSPWIPCQPDPTAAGGRRN